MKKHTLWITGAGGLIGSHLAEMAPSVAPDLAPMALTRQNLDLTNHDAVARRFALDSPEMVIHCAAISDSRQCENHPELAQRVNVEATAFLAELFASRRMVFFSTDLVFDGIRGNYAEGDAPHPLGVYARTKVEAETAVLAHPQHLVIRTSLNCGTSPKGNRGFNETLATAWKQNKVTTLFVDEFRCPIPASITALATWELVLEEAQGIFHVAGSERLSRFAIGQLVANRHPELNPRIEPGSIQDYEGPPRAADCSLNCDEAQSRLSFLLPGLTEWVNTSPVAPF
ncbi:MAG: SDR family oxidoreductase [Verrucomicrobia bacterium]|nr:SDR family oxidoreductase [Verrucomicrobiota bacterium]